MWAEGKRLYMNLLTSLNKLIIQDSYIDVDVLTVRVKSLCGHCTHNRGNYYVNLSF